MYRRLCAGISGVGTVSIWVIWIVVIGNLYMLIGSWQNIKVYSIIWRLVMPVPIYIPVDKDAEGVFIWNNIC